MNFIFLFTVISFTTIYASPTGSQCEFTTEAIEKDLLSCVAHDPRLMLQIIEHLNNPESMANAEFICSNQKDLVDVLVCMEDKLASCLPSGNIIISVLPSKQKWLDGLKFICDHRTDLIENKCMQSSMPEFYTCYLGKLQSLPKLFGGATKENFQNAICSVVRMEESCIQAFHGTCTRQVIDLMLQSLEIFFPMNTCPVANVDIQNPEMNNLVNSILVHGQPLHFQSQQDINYNVVPN